MTCTINIVGCGRLGKTIGKLLVLHKVGVIAGVFNTTKENAHSSVTFIGQGKPIHKLSDLPKADITFITARDDKIEEICKELILTNKIEANSIVVHCSGALSSDILNSAKRLSCHVASIHPVKSFADPDQAVITFRGTYCSFEGDKTISDQIENLFTKIGGVVIKIDKENKKQYHAATVMANNYLVTLHHHAVKNFIASGMKPDDALNMVNMLMKDAFTNISLKGHKGALTGPIQRGDIDTIRGHIQSLEKHPVSKNIYSFLGLGTLELTSHPKELKQEFIKTFHSSSDFKDKKIESNVKIKSSL